MNEQQRPSPASPDGPPGSDAGWLAGELRALPPLPAPPGTWQRVLQRATERREARRIGRRRRRVGLALAAGLLAALGAVLLVGERGDRAADVRSASSVAARTFRPHPGTIELAWPQTPVAASAEHLVLARISSIDAALNRELLHGNGARPALLRQRETLTESLAHIQRHRQQMLVRQAVY